MRFVILTSRSLPPVTRPRVHFARIRVRGIRKLLCTQRKSDHGSYLTRHLLCNLNFVKLSLKYYLNRAATTVLCKQVGGGLEY